MQCAGAELSIIPFHIVRILDRLRATMTPDQARSRLSAGPTDNPAPALRGARRATRASLTSLWTQLKEAGVATAAEERALADPDTLDAAEGYAANIENMIGTVKVPVGIVGPL